MKELALRETALVNGGERCECILDTYHTSTKKWQAENKEACRRRCCESHAGRFEYSKARRYWLYGDMTKWTKC